MLRRLSRLSWKYGGCTPRDVGFLAAFPYLYPDSHKALKDLYARVATLCRYLRQSADWCWELTHEEASLWEEALADIIRSECGGTANGAMPPMSPFGFGDNDAGG